MIGRRPREMIRIRPDSSAIFMTPSHRAMMPIRPIEISTAVFAMSMAASVTASMRPVKTPTTTPMAIMPNQM
ncbi:MAG: hypothetical protein P8Y54_14720 [Xanthomonadales bacterium]